MVRRSVDRDRSIGPSVLLVNGGGKDRAANSRASHLGTISIPKRVLSSPCHVHISFEHERDATRWMAR